MSSRVGLGISSFVSLECASFNKFLSFDPFLSLSLGCLSSWDSLLSLELFLSLERLSLPFLSLSFERLLGDSDLLLRSLLSRDLLLSRCPLSREKRLSFDHLLRPSLLYLSRSRLLRWSRSLLRRSLISRSSREPCSGPLDNRPSGESKRSLESPLGRSGRPGDEVRSLLISR